VVIGRDVMLDAGPLIALLDDRDQWFEPARQAWPALIDRCVTTEPAVVEATHMVARRRQDPALVLEFLIAAGIPVFAPHLLLHEACVHLIRRYGDLPMDYADAVQVALADRLGIRRVFTFDRRGFSRYRGATGLPFEVLP
jgi:predicted nucleic acid-binding protein